MPVQTPEVADELVTRDASSDVAGLLHSPHGMLGRWSYVYLVYQYVSVYIHTRTCCRHVATFLGVDTSKSGEEHHRGEYGNAISRLIPATSGERPRQFTTPVKVWTLYCGDSATMIYVDRFGVKVYRPENPAMAMQWPYYSSVIFVSFLFWIPRLWVSVPLVADKHAKFSPGWAAPQVRQTCIRLLKHLASGSLSDRWPLINPEIVENYSLGLDEEV